MNGLDSDRPVAQPPRVPPTPEPSASSVIAEKAAAFARALDGARRETPGTRAERSLPAGEKPHATGARDDAVPADGPDEAASARRPPAATASSADGPDGASVALEDDEEGAVEPRSVPPDAARPEMLAAPVRTPLAGLEEREPNGIDAPSGAAAIAAPVAAGVTGAETLAGAPGGAGSTAPALEAAAIGTLMGELQAIDAPGSGQWRFALAGNALGLDSLVLSRGDGGVWNLRLSGERARAGGARAELDALREALHQRGHRVGDIVVGGDDAGEPTA